MQFSRADDGYLNNVPIIWDSRHELTPGKSPEPGDANVTIIFHDDCIRCVSLLIEMFNCFQVRSNASNLPRRNLFWIASLDDFTQITTNVRSTIIGRDTSIVFDLPILELIFHPSPSLWLIIQIDDIQRTKPLQFVS